MKQIAAPLAKRSVAPVAAATAPTRSPADATIGSPADRHCIVATSLNAAMPALPLANQILDPGTTLCGSRNQIAAQLFKP